MSKPLLITGGMILAFLAVGFIIHSRRKEEDLGALVGEGFGEVLATEKPVLKKIELKRYRSGDLKVYLVDGKYIRDHIYQDFTMGGHDKVYHFIPLGEIWIDDNLKAAEVDATVAHEKYERDRMLRGVPYRQAHEEANKVERETRAGGKPRGPVISRWQRDWQPTPQEEGIIFQAIENPQVQALAAAKGKTKELRGLILGLYPQVADFPRHGGDWGVSADFVIAESVIYLLRPKGKPREPENPYVKYQHTQEYMGITIDQQRELRRCWRRLGKRWVDDDLRVSSAQAGKMLRECNNALKAKRLEAKVL